MPTVAGKRRLNATAPAVSVPTAATANESCGAPPPTHTSSWTSTTSTTATTRSTLTGSGRERRARAGSRSTPSNLDREGQPCHRPCG